MVYSANRWLEFVRMTDSQLLKEAKKDVYKGSGKGGQKRNKVENAIRLHIGRVQVSETRSRSKEENLSGALKKLRVALALDYLSGTEIRVLLRDPPKEILPYLGQEEIRISPKNAVFPIYIGWFLDRFLAHADDLGSFAVELGVSKSQIRKFLERNPVLYQVTQEAQELGVLFKGLSQV